MNTITTYSVSELKDKFPEAFEKVLEKWAQHCDEDVFWADEIYASMKKVFVDAGLTLTNWELGAYNYCSVTFTIPTYWSELAEVDMLVDDYTGKDAKKWLKGAFGIKSFKKVKYTDHEGNKSHRWDIIMSDGKEFDCPFTGYCADYDYMYSLLDSIEDGQTLDKAFHNLAKVCGKLIEQEIEYQSSEEYFLEHADANDFSYTENGIRI